jgi:hypothetical protein
VFILQMSDAGLDRGAAIIGYPIKKIAQAG